MKDETSYPISVYVCIHSNATTPEPTLVLFVAQRPTQYGMMGMKVLISMVSKTQRLVKCMIAFTNGWYLQYYRY